MSAVRVDVTGSADPADAWRRYVTRGEWAGWAPHIRGVRPDGSPVRPGQRGVVLGPLGLRLGYQVLARDDRLRRWSWRVGPGPFGVRMEHGVDAHPHGCRVWVDLHLPRPVAAGYAPLARAALRGLAG